MVYKEAVTLTSADKSLVCAIRMGAIEEYQTTSSPSFLARSIAQWEKKLGERAARNSGIEARCTCINFSLTGFFTRAKDVE